MIFNNMTEKQWIEWKKKVDAAMNTDIKEYHSLLELLLEVSDDRAMNRQFEWGDPARYIGRLKSVLSRLKKLSKYPKLIDSPELRDKKYFAEIPLHTESQIPDASPVQPVPVQETTGKWSRWLKFDTYKDLLSSELKKEGEGLGELFTQRRYYHDLMKNQEKEGVDPKEISRTVENLKQANSRIEDYFDRVEAFMNGTDQTEQDELKLRANGKPSGSFSKEEIDQMMSYSPEFAGACKMKRMEANRKYLSRTDLKNPKDPDEILLRFRELKEWGMDVSQYESVVALIENEQA